MLVRSEQIRGITKKLSEFTTYVKLSNDLDRTDVNRDAEYFYCKPLSILLGGEFKNLNSEERNYPAVDLGNSEKRICVQVTSTNDRAKIQKTLDKFFANKQEKLFDRVIVLIIGEKQKYKKDFKVQKNFKFSMKDDVWDSARLLQEIQNLPDEELAAVDAYLSRQIPGRKEEQGPALTLKDSLPPRTPQRCIGRETELEELERLLAEGCNPVYIWGLGGMGKTELAIHFGQEQRERRVHFVRFKETFRLTITTGLADLVEGLPRKLPGSDISRPEQEIYKDVMAVMARHRDDILIVDNVDGDLEVLLDSDYQALLNNGPRLIITTRNEKPGYVHVDRLEEKYLAEIFRKHRAVVTEQEIRDLIDAVNGHTLTIDLMARTLRGGWVPVKARDILDALSSHDLPNRISRKVGSDYRGDKAQEKIYAHLRVLFNVAGIPETGREVLRYATLLPEAGMDAGLFFSALPPRIGEETMDALSDRGWLGVGGNVATIHPVVRLVCHEELKPTDDNCAAFLDALWGRYDDRTYDQQLYTQLADLFASATDRLTDSRGAWADHGRKLWHAVGQADKAIVLCEKVLHIRENAAEPDLPALAAAYNDLGHLHRDLGHYQLCLEYLEKALALRQEVLSRDDPDLAMSYNNVGVAYSELGDYYKSLEYQEKAMELRKQVLPPDHPDLAMSYSNVGSSYGDLGDNGKALEYKEKALEISQRILPPDHPNIAFSYNSVGITYGALGNHGKALEYKEKALEIRQRILPPDHPDIALSYDSVGSTYGYLGNHGKALEYHEKALEIRQRILPPDHPEVARSYNNVGTTYDNLDDHEKALKYKETALEIRQRVLPPDHPDIAWSYHSVGYSYGYLGDFEQALAYLGKAAVLIEKALPPGHPYIRMIRQDLAYWTQVAQMPKWQRLKMGFRN